MRSQWRPHITPIGIYEYEKYSCISAFWGPHIPPIGIHEHEKYSYISAFSVKTSHHPQAIGIRVFRVIFQCVPRLRTSNHPYRDTWIRWRVFQVIFPCVPRLRTSNHPYRDTWIRWRVFQVIFQSQCVPRLSRDLTVIDDPPYHACSRGFEKVDITVWILWIPLWYLINHPWPWPWPLTVTVTVTVTATRELWRGNSSVSGGNCASRSGGKRLTVTVRTWNAGHGHGHGWFFKYQIVIHA